MLIAIARLGTPEWVGQFAYALAIAAPLMLFLDLQLRTVQATDRSSVHTPFHYKGLRIRTGLLGVGLATVLAIALGLPFSMVLIVALVTVSKAIESVGDVTYGYFQRIGRMDVIGKGQIAKGLSTLVAVVAGLIVSDALWGGVLALVCSWSLLYFAIDTRTLAAIWDSERPQDLPTRNDCQDQESLWLVVRSALPLGAVALLASLTPNLPRYVLEAEHGLRELGIFAAMAYLLAVGTTFVSATGNVVAPRLAVAYAAGNEREFRRLTMLLIAAGAALLVGGTLLAALAGGPLLSVIYGPEYARQAPVLTVLMIAGGLSYCRTLIAYALTAARQLKSQVPSMVAGSVVVGLVAVALVPRLGAMGAATSLLIGYAAQLFGMLYQLWRLPIPQPLTRAQ